MSTLALTQPAIDLVVDAFLQAPLNNPDGNPGIDLIVLTDEIDLPFVPALPSADGCFPDNQPALRAAYFGTQAERNDPESAAILAAKAKAYRYSLVTYAIANSSLAGCGTVGGDDTVLYLNWQPNDFNLAALFMHELGHNLGLHHGGLDTVNGKPNYPSIMNYTMSYPYQWSQHFWRLDYSRAGPEEFEILAEANLNELTGIGSPGGQYSAYFMPYGINFDNNGTFVRTPRLARLNGSAIDFGDESGNGFPDGLLSPSVAQDLNYTVLAPPGIVLPSTPSPAQILIPHNDWANIRLATKTSLGPGAPAASMPVGELTTEAIAWIDQNFPIAPNLACPADLSGDGILDNGDIGAFITAFLAGDLSTDFNGDGILDNGDIGAFITAFLAGC